MKIFLMIMILFVFPATIIGINMIANYFLITKAYGVELKEWPVFFVVFGVQGIILFAIHAFKAFIDELSKELS